MDFFDRRPKKCQGIAFLRGMTRSWQVAATWTIIRCHQSPGQVVVMKMAVSCGECHDVLSIRLGNHSCF